MKHALILLVVVALGCSNAKTSALAAEAWGVDDYAKVGLRIDKPWEPADYTNAANVLQQQTAGHRERLPRFHGPGSGPVFDKIIADLVDDPAASVKERLAAHMERGEAVNAISKLYLDNIYATPSREWIELNAVAMREAVVLSSLVQPFLDSFGSDDPKREVRLAGLEKMRAGYGTMLVGGLLVADQLRVPEDDRVAMLGHVTKVLPALYPTLTSELQRQIRDLIGKQVEAFPAGKLHHAIVAAQEALPK